MGDATGDCEDGFVFVIGGVSSFGLIGLTTDTTPDGFAVGGASFLDCSVNSNCSVNSDCSISLAVIPFRNLINSFLRSASLTIWIFFSLEFPLKPMVSPLDRSATNGRLRER